MRQVTKEQLTRLISASEPPCISLYQPTHRSHPENQQDPIRYRNLLVEMEASLREKYPTRQVRPIIEKFQSLARDDQFWNYRTEGLAVFASPERFEFYELQRAVPELINVADSFHTKPIIRILQSADRYQILCLSRQDAKLFEGNRDALDAVEITEFPANIKDALGDQRTESHQVVGAFGAKDAGSGGAIYHGHGSRKDEIDTDMVRFFRSIDRGILEHHSRPSGLPLMLAALPENQRAFRETSHNPLLMDGGIAVNPDALNFEELRAQAWQKVEPYYLERLEKLKDSFQSARAQHSGSADLSDAARAAVAGRVATLLVEAEKVLPGTIDRTTGAIHPGELASPDVDDMLDDLAELVLSKGGEVVVVPRERMPTDSGLAATYRF